MHKCAFVHLNFCKWRQFGNYEIIGILCILSIITGLNFYFDPYLNIHKYFSVFVIFDAVCVRENGSERVDRVCAWVCAMLSFVIKFSEKCWHQRFLMLFLIWYNSKLWSRITFCTLLLDKLLFLNMVDFSSYFFHVCCFFPSPIQCTFENHTQSFYFPCSIHRFHYGVFPVYCVVTVFGPEQLIFGYPKENLMEILFFFFY